MAWIALGVGGASVALTARLLAAWGPRRAWAITVALAAVTTVVLPLSASGIVGAALVAAVFGWAYTAATGALIAWTTDLDADRAAAGTALLFVMLVLGQGVGAAVLGL
ncbi:MFS transporter, partial [Microbacterium sp. SUBG005]